MVNSFFSSLIIQLDLGELKTVQLSGLHVPESYLAAVIQTAARKNQWPLDKVTFSTDLTKWQTNGENCSSICLSQ